jgi:hypothetical protein
MDYIHPNTDNNELDTDYNSSNTDNDQMNTDSKLTDYGLY